MKLKDMKKEDLELLSYTKIAKMILEENIYSVNETTPRMRGRTKDAKSSMSSPMMR